MTQNLKYKLLAIVAVTLVCLYGIIGLPTSVDQLKANVAKNIRLGLDLKGGSQLAPTCAVQFINQHQGSLPERASTFRISHK